MVVLVDYENVNEAGLTGLKKLTKEDTLYLFHNNSSKMSIEIHCAIEKLTCKKVYQEVKSNTKNALDFLLVTILGELIANDSESFYVIISKDQGFDVVVNYRREQGIAISRYPNIQNISKKAQQADTPPVTEEQVKRLFDSTEQNNNVDVKAVTTLINKYKTKQGLNNALVKKFGSETTGGINKIIKPLIKNKKAK